MSKVYQLATQGYTNAEIFAALELSSGELKRQLKANHPMVFDIVLGRQEYCKQFLEILQGIAIGLTNPESRQQYHAILEILQRMDQQTKNLTIGYDLALLEQIPAMPMLHAAMGAEALTAALRVAK